MRKTKLLLSVFILIFACIFIVSCKNEKEEFDASSLTICLDAGHGFKDVGCPMNLSSRYEYEKDCTIDIVNKIKDVMEQKGITVVLTHDGKTFPTDEYLFKKADKLGITYDESLFEENDNFSKTERALYQQIIEKTIDVDMFISIHINSIENADYLRGASIDYCKENPNLKFLRLFSSILKTDFLESKISSDFIIYEDDYDDSYKVTKDTETASALIELGYSTNIDDSKLIDSDEWQMSVAEVLCNSIISTYTEGMK